MNQQIITKLLTRIECNFSEGSLQQLKLIQTTQPINILYYYQVKFLIISYNPYNQQKAHYSNSYKFFVNCLGFACYLLHCNYNELLCKYSDPKKKGL